MKPSIRRGTGDWQQFWLRACAAAGCSQSASTSGTSGTKTTITEEDYFNTPGQIAALAAYSKAFEAAHPGVTVKRQYVPFADLDAKLLTQAAGQDLPNLLAVDNPFVSTMISTGQVVPISGLSGLQHDGLLPCRDRRGPLGRQVLQPPRGRGQLDRADLQHRDVQGSEPDPAEDLGGPGVRRQGTDDLGSLRDRIDL